MSHHLLCNVVFVFCFSFIGDKLLKSPEISPDFKQMQRALTAHSLPCERGIVCVADSMILQGPLDKMRTTDWFLIQIVMR